MDLAGGHAELSQAISARADANLEAAVEIMTTDLQGEVTLRVDDADTGRLLGQATESEKDSSWHRLRVRVETPSPQVRMRIIGTGTGQVRLDHARLGPPLIIPPVKHVRWFPASENFSLSGTLTVSVQGRAGPALGGALDMLAQDLDKLNIKLMRLKQGVGQLQIDIGPEYGVQGEGAEAYSLLVNPLGIWVQAKDERGAFYGLMTLLQLIKSSEDGKAVAIAGEITDYPDMPMRGVFLTGGSITGKGLEEDLQVMARLRMNTAIASLDTYHYKTDPKAKDRIQQFLQACRRFNLEPIPLQCTLGWGYYVIEHNPNLAEGTYITGEKLTLNGEEPVELAHRNVLRTELTDIVLQSVDGKTTYKPGVDYRIIPGEIKFADHQFWADVKPFAVARIATGSIPDGATVLASYDAVVQTGKTRYGYCPTEPETRRIMGEWITNVAKDWPFHYNFISMDELHGRFCTDSRCLNSGKSPAQVLAEHLHFLDEKAHEGNPDLRLMMWGDAVDPFDKAGSVGVADIGPLLPKDIIQCVWGYEANTPQARGFKGVEYFSNLGITTFVCPWYDFTNIRQWAQVVAEARRRGWPCLGLVDSVWYSNADGVEEAAICSWEIPKKGDPRYVPLTIE